MKRLPWLRTAALVLALCLVGAACSSSDDDDEAGDDTDAAVEGDAPGADTDFCKDAVALTELQEPGVEEGPDALRAYFEESLEDLEGLVDEAPDEIKNEMQEFVSVYAATGEYLEQYGFDVAALQANPPEEEAPTPTPEQEAALQAIGEFLADECGIGAVAEDVPIDEDDVIVPEGGDGEEAPAPEDSGD